MNSRRVFVLVLFGLLLVGCATLQTPEPGTPLYEQSVREAQLQLVENIEDQSRLRGIVYPILISNTDLCKSRVRKWLNFEWLTTNELRLIGDIQRDAGVAIGISTFPTVTVVTPGSPSFQAGLRTGDMLVSIGEVLLNEDKEEGFIRWLEGNADDGRRYYRRYVDRTLRAAEGDHDTVALEYKRGEETHRIEVRPEERCNFKIATVNHDDISSKVTDDVIIISSALLAFAESDSEVQYLLAHELAHSIYKHRPGKLTPLRALALGADAAINYGLLVPQLLAGGLASASGESMDQVFLPGAFFSRQNNPPYRPVLELEADYLAMYMLTRSGIDVTGYPDLWRRIPSESQLAKVHVMEDERIENMKAVQEEIDRKLNANLPLVPASTKKVEDKTKAL